MSFVPDFGSIFCGLLVWSGSMALLSCIRRIDDDVRACCKSRVRWTTIIVSTGNALAVCGLFCLADYSVFECISVILLGIYLSACTIMDILLCQVSDFLQYIGLWGGSMWVYMKEADSGMGVSFLIFVLLQYLLFMRLYGKADGMAFCMCALYWLGLGFDMEMYLYHMGLSMVLLAIVQAFRGNISKKGNLKQPVAMYPYISASFWVLFLQIIG